MPISKQAVVNIAIVLLAVGIAALIGIVGTTMWLSEKARNSVETVMMTRDMRAAAVQMRLDLLASESSQRGFLTTGNEIYLAPYETARDQVLLQFDVLQKLITPTARGEAALDRLKVVASDKIAEMDRTILLKRAGNEADVAAILRSNRGKALMDEANVFLSGIIERADQRLTSNIEDQRSSTNLLRLVSIIAAFVIVFVVGLLVSTLGRYTREIAQTRDEVRSLNTHLEERVEARTQALAQARDRAEILLSEVNHRVANSLNIVASLVKLQGNAIQNKVVKEALKETEGRIMAISTVHQRLYASGEVGFVALDEYLGSLLDHLSASMREEGHGAVVKYELEPVRLVTDASINLGVIVTEWVTNAFKYAYPDGSGEVRVKLRKLDDERAELVVEDDGVGYHASAPSKGTGLGGRIVKSIAASMGTQAEYLEKGQGMSARLNFAVMAG